VDAQIATTQREATNNLKFGVDTDKIPQEEKAIIIGIRRIAL